MQCEETQMAGMRESSESVCSTAAPTQFKRVVCTVGDKISEAELAELLSNIDIDKSTNSVRPF
jgi:hypothetical protein